MRTLRILFIFLISELAFSQEFLNLSFEYKVQGTEIPKKWRLITDGYQITIDSTQKNNHNKTLRVKSTDPLNRQVGGFANTFPVDLVRGKTIEFIGQIKTNLPSKGYAALWWRTDNTSESSENVESNPIKGNQDWTKVYIKQKVSPNATYINFGAVVQGEGASWFDDFELVIDGKKFNDLEPRLNEPTPDELTWLKQYIYPITSVEPGSSEKKDLKALNKLIGQSQVIALGETSHGSSEIFKIKHRLIKYLVEEKDFSIFSIEANMPESHQLGHYINTEKGDPVELLKGMHYWNWYTQEVLQMVEWMKLTNRTKRVQFTGFDMQTYTGSIQELEGVFQTKEEIVKTIDELKQELDFVSRQSKDSISTSVITQRRTKINNLLSSLRKYIATSTFAMITKQWLFQNICIIEQYMDTNWFSRDKYMAENVLWIKANNPESKIAIWAHNGHIKKSGFSMGKYLKRSLGDNYLAIGFAFHKGYYTAKGNNGISTYKAQDSYPGTYEYFFNAVKTPVFILDLRAAMRDTNANGKWLVQTLGFRTTGAVKTEEEFENTMLTEDFDLLIFINESTNTMLLDF